MHRIEIPKINYIYEYASSWEELGRKDALYASWLLYLVSVKEINPLVFKKLMIDRLLNRKNKANKQTLHNFDWLRSEDKNAIDVLNYWGNEAKLGETMNFFFRIESKKDDNEEEFDEYDINPLFVKNLVPYVRRGLKKYYGPGDMITDISLLELKEAIVCCEEFNSSGNIVSLHRLAAILYRRQKSFMWLRKMFYKFDGNKRRKLNLYKIDRESKRLGKIKGFGFYCFLFFNACLNHIYSNPIIIDGKEYDFSVLINSPGDDEDGNRSESLGFTGVMYAIAETNIFGDMDKVANANIFDVLVSLYRGYLLDKEMRSKFK